MRYSVKRLNSYLNAIFNTVAAMIYSTARYTVFELGKVSGLPDDMRLGTSFLSVRNELVIKGSKIIDQFGVF